MQIPHQTYKIDLNNINEPLTRMIESVNDKGVRFVDVELWANSQKVTLPQNSTATAAFVTDGFLINESVDCSISDDLTTVIVPIDNSKIESKSGIMLVEIKITENGNILTPPFAFKVRVKKSITEDANVFEKSYGTVSEILKEVAEARGNSKTLKEEIATKADKTEVDTALVTKADKATTYNKNEIDNLLIYDKLSVATAITVTMQSDSYCTKTGKVVSNTSFTCTNKITLADYSALSITSAYGYEAPLVVFFDENDNLLSYELINESGIVKVTEQIINIPTSATTAIVNHANNTPAISVSGIKNEVVTIGQRLSDLITELSPLKGKSLYVDGDSIANGAGSGNYAFGEFLRDKYGMVLTKGAVNGATLLVDDTHTNSICKRITQLTGEYDYIIFDGGINDVSQSLPLGSKTYHYNGGYDITTTLGALEQICYYLVTNYFDSKKLFVIVHKILTVDNPVIPTKELDMFNAIKEVLQKWGIPYVDIYNDTNLGAFNSDINNAYFKLNSSGEGDRVHPTKDAYAKFYMPLIEAKIKTL